MAEVIKIQVLKLLTYKTEIKCKQEKLKCNTN